MSMKQEWVGCFNFREMVQVYSDKWQASWCAGEIGIVSFFLRVKQSGLCLICLYKLEEMINGLGQWF